ncbi:MAG: Hsp20/alpha crystallin family protein [Peptococcaceae bacterium]|nr:Hsp20/alpha crystallin family protein [Peptococcaceae bacterium]
MFGLVPFRRNNPVNNSNFISPWSDIERVIDNFFNNSFFPLYNGLGSMKVDIKETDQEYIVEAEIPGVNKEDIKVELDDDLLTIQVQANEEINEERDRYIRRERRCSSMSRSFYVENVQTDNITAKYENGILSIKLPKINPGHQSKKTIDIN